MDNAPKSKENFPFCTNLANSGIFELSQNKEAALPWVYCTSTLNEAKKLQKEKEQNNAQTAAYLRDLMGERIKYYCLLTRRPFI